MPELAATAGPLQAATQPPAIVGFHHVRLPVTDVLTSRDWYIDTLGFQPMLVEENESGVVGTALQHPGGVVLGLHRDPARATALRGFVAVAFAVADLGAWVVFLRSRNLMQGEPIDTHLGRCVRSEDPDGILVELHTVTQPSAADA
jgi:catechol 2,3-dioxygenase-like lactoylglutathione lyase family enzyme